MLQGAQGREGLTSEHWLVSTVSFTMIIHIIVYKLFLETVFWNIVSVATALLCFFLYYIIVIIGNSNGVASVF